VIAHHRAGSRIAGVDRGVKAGDVIKVGKTVELECMDTPGHTMCHICLRSHGDDAGAVLGRHAVQCRRRQLPQRRQPRGPVCDLRRPARRAARRHAVYPGHDYIENNLRFTLAREPDNAAANEMLPAVSGQDPATARVTTLAEEKRINTFLRLTSASVIAKLREEFPDLPERPDAKTVFVKLRELRNRW
jgi:hydroxyacylglutathione hydrolase